MPVSTRGKGTAGERGGKTTRDSASEKKAKMNEGFTAAQRCAERLARESEARRDARDNRDLTLGEQVIRVPLTRDLTIRELNPFKLSELRCSSDLDAKRMSHVERVISRYNGWNLRDLRLERLAC